MQHRAWRCAPTAEHVISNICEKTVFLSIARGSVPSKARETRSRIFPAREREKRRSSILLRHASGRDRNTCNVFEGIRGPKGVTPFVFYVTERSHSRCVLARVPKKKTNDLRAQNESFFIYGAFSSTKGSLIRATLEKTAGSSCYNVTTPRCTFSIYWARRFADR